MLEPVDGAQVVLGGGLFLLPGVIWTQVLVPRLPWPHKVPVAVVFAFTFEPGVLFAAHLFLDVPLSVEVHTFLAAMLALIGSAFLARRATRAGRFDPEPAHRASKGPDETGSATVSPTPGDAQSGTPPEP